MSTFLEDNQAFCTNHILPDFDEASASQIPAVVQLINLGYNYISRSDVKKLRNDSTNQYILRSIAERALRKINSDEISEKSIIDAVNDLENMKFKNAGVQKVSEQIYSNLLTGVSVSEFVNGRKTSPQLKLIDWSNIQNNEFHICVEFEISEDANRRPDIVLFVNGIPFAVIECKKPSVNVNEAIDQHLRNQQGNNIPKFFLFTQILAATNVSTFKYGTMLTPAKYYSVWKEENEDEKLLNSLNPVSELAQIKQDLVRENFNYKIPKSVSEQTKGLYNILRPERLLGLVRSYVIYDRNIKKIARYQQYFAVQKSMARINGNPRRGGLIWHTQGSGKSLTMVFLVKILIEQLKNPRIVIVTDRKQLNHQISGVFNACKIKKEVIEAKSAKDLVRSLKEKSVDVIVTLVQKFDRTKDSFTDYDDNIFILIDEAHRTQGGEANARMNVMMPNACQIAFTGTPLMSKEKASSAEKFGGIIDAYTMKEAEEDGAVLPLVYQAWYVDMILQSRMLDEFYNSITEPMTEEEKKKFEREMNLAKMIENNSSRIEAIALSVCKHYKEFFRNTGLKGQVVVPSKYAAVLFQEALERISDIRTAVIISDTKDDKENKSLPEMKEKVAKYIAEEKRRYGSLELYEKNMIDSFRDDPDGVELIIVVDKLLTGFDAPRNTVLYLAKQLKDHNLMQAIARVNRLFDGDNKKPIKTNGIIIDYSKNAENLKNAMALFANYDPEDVKGTLVSTEEKIKSLQNIYENLLDTFKEQSTTDDCLNLLKTNEMVREKFYEEVNNFINNFYVSISLPDFSQHFSADKLKKYGLELKKFVELKKSVKTALAEKIDFSKYCAQLHQILDRYVGVEKVEQLSKTINLSDVNEFNRFVEDQENGMSDRSKAEAIAAQTEKIITERRKSDEVFYSNFSDRINVLLTNLRNAKHKDISNLLEEMKKIQQHVSGYENEDIPEVIKNKKYLHPFFRNLRQYFENENEKNFLKIVIDIVGIIQKKQIVDWWTNKNIRNEIINEIYDYLFDNAISDNVQQIKNVGEISWTLAVENKEIL